jgi:cell division septation protein DedD
MRRSDPEIGGAVARARRGWRWAALPVVAGFALFGIIVWLAYKDTSRGAPIGEAPLIRAAADPIKLPPEEAEESTVAEGGVVGRLWSDAERADQPERLLPLPEQPRSPPVGAAGASTEQARQDPARPDLPAASAAPRDGAATAGGGSADASAPQPAERAALADAETALDRLLAEMTALSDEPPTSTGAARPAPGLDQAREEPPAASPPSAVAEAATSTTMGRPAPVEPVGPSEAERDVAAASPVPDASTTETPPVGQASALRPPPARPEPAPRERSEPASAAEPTPAPAQSTQVAAIDDRFRVQVAAVREEVDARRAWDLFVADLGPVLRDVQPFFERAQTANGIFYRVQIGPFATQQAAESLCEELKQRNASCFVIRR